MTCFCNVADPEGGVSVVIHHNSAYGTSRNTLGLIRNSDIELDLLPTHQGEFRKEDRELVVDSGGRPGA